MYPLGRPAGVALGLVAALAPTGALAHVKWFEDPSRFPFRPDLILSGRTALLVLASAVALLLLYVLQRLVGSRDWPQVGFLRRMALGAPTLLAVQSAVTLVHAAVQPAVLAPNLPLPLSWFGYALALLQLAVAFSFITGLGDWVGALVLLALGPLALLAFPPVDVLDQLFWVGIAVVLLVIGRVAVAGNDARPWFQRRDPAWSSRAVAALRVLTGLAILMPALSEKLWNPELGRAFLTSRPAFNVPRHVLGWEWLSDDLFVLLAGLVEGVIGVLLVSGLLTRVVILGMWLPFNAGVPFLGPTELLGHLPIFGIMYFLLVHGAGALPRRPTEAAGSPDQPARAAGASSAAPG